MKHFIRLSIIASLLVACSPKEARRTEHAGPKNWVAQQDFDQEESVSASAKDFSKFSTDYVNAALKQSGQGVLQQLVAPLSKALLNKATLESPETKGSTLVKVLSNLNNGMIKILTENPRTVNNQEITPYANRYISAVFHNCDAKMNLCPQVAFFRRDPKSARVVYLISTLLEGHIDQLLRSAGQGRKAGDLSPERLCIQNQESCRVYVAAKYRYLAMALLLRASSYNDQELAFSYLKHAKAYSQLVAYRDSLQDASAKEQLSYLDRVHEHLTETTFAYFQPKNNRSKEFKEFVERFEPWTFSQQTTTSSLLSTRKMFEYATKCCLYDPPMSGKIAVSMRDAIETVQSRSDEWGKSFVQMTAEILNDPNQSTIFSNMGVAEEAKQIAAKNPALLDEYFFIIDRLYRNHIEFADAKKILENTLPNTRSKILKTALMYARISLIHMIVETNKNMAEISTGSAVSSELYFQEMLNKSRIMSERWLTMQSRLNSVIKLIGSEVKSSGRLNTEYAELEKQFKGISRNLHYFSIYPNMMMLTYYMADKRGSMKGRTFWGREYTVSPDTIIQDFFNGTIEPWFKYAESLETLSRTMLLYSYYYALTTNSFETFGAYKSSSGENSVTHLGFFQKVIGKYLGLDNRNLDDMIVRHYEKMINTSEYKTVKLACDFEQGRTSKSPVIQINLLQVPDYTYLGSPSDGAGSNYAMGDNIGPITSLFSTDLGRDLNTIRNRIEPRILFVRAMVALLEKHLKGTDPELIAQINSTLQETENKIAHIYGQATTYYRSLIPCINDLNDLEQYRQYRVYAEERAYLEKVHGLLTQIQATPEDLRPALIAKINQDNFADSRFEKIRDGESYFYSRYDLLKRIASYLSKDIFHEPTAEDQRFYSPAKLAQLSRTRRVVVEENIGIDQESIIKNIEGRNIPYVADRETFVLYGLSALNGSDKGLLSWWSRNQLGIIPHQLAIRTGIELLLADQYRSLRVDRPECLAYRTANVPADCFVKNEIKAKEVVENQRRLLQYISLDDRDVKYLATFGFSSKFQLSQKANSSDKDVEITGLTNALGGLVLEKTSLRPLPPYSYLLQTLQLAANITYSTQYDTVKPEEGQRLVQNGFFVAQTVNNLDQFLFQPNLDISGLLKSIYSPSVNKPFRKINEVLSEIRNIELSQKNWEPLRYKIEGGALLSIDAAKADGAWVFVEPQKRLDFEIRTKRFTNETQNFFNTREAVQNVNAERN